MNLMINWDLITTKRGNIIEERIKAVVACRKSRILKTSEVRSLLTLQTLRIELVVKWGTHLGQSSLQISIENVRVN